MIFIIKFCIILSTINVDRFFCESPGRTICEVYREKNSPSCSLCVWRRAWRTCPCALGRTLGFRTPGGSSAHALRCSGLSGSTCKGRNKMLSSRFIRKAINNRKLKCNHKCSYYFDCIINVVQDISHLFFGACNTSDFSAFIEEYLLGIC